MVLQTIGGLVSGIGLFSAIISVYGIHFYGKNLYMKAHCAGITDSFAVPMIVLGLGISSLSVILFFKMLFLIIFLVMTCATSCHCLCNLQYTQDLEDQKK